MVSTHGRVWSLYKEFINYSGTLRKYNACLLSPVANKEGYMKVSMSVMLENGRRKQKLHSVHRLMAFSFIPNPNNYDQINHIDGNKSNNMVSNLEWCTLSLNRQHAYATGLQKGALGELQGNSKLTSEQIVAIRGIGKSKTLLEISGMFNISFQHVSDIINRKCWKHI